MRTPSLPWTNLLPAENKLKKKGLLTSFESSMLWFSSGKPVPLRSCCELFHHCSLHGTLEAPSWPGDTGRSFLMLLKSSKGDGDGEDGEEDEEGSRGGGFFKPSARGL